MPNNQLFLQSFCFNKYLIICHFESHLHMVAWAVTTSSTVQITFGRSWDEVVVFPRLKLHPTWGWSEWSKGDGKVHQFMRLIANCNNSRIGIGDATWLIFIFANTVNYISLYIIAVSSWTIHRADDVNLIILPGIVAAIDIDDMVSVVNPKDWICCVPVDIVTLSSCKSFTAYQQKSNL